MGTGHKIWNGNWREWELLHGFERDGNVKNHSRTFLSAPSRNRVDSLSVLKWYGHTDVQGLKYNIQGGGTIQLSGPPVCSPAHVSISGSQIINDRLNVLSMIFVFFLQFCKIL